MSVIKDANGQQRLQTTFKYKDLTNVTFNPANSNYTEAKCSATAVARKLSNKGVEAVKTYNDQIKKGVNEGAFELMSEEEIANLGNVEHHFTMHSAVFASNSASTKCRLVNNTSTVIPGQVATITTQ